MIALTLLLLSTLDIVLDPRLPADSEVPVVLLDAGGQLGELLTAHTPVRDPQLPDVDAAGQHPLYCLHAQGDSANNKRIM